VNLGTIRQIRSLIILILDFAAILGIFSAVYYLRLDRLPDYQSLDLWLIVLTFISILYLTGTYFKERSHALPALPIRTFFICLVCGAVCIVWVYLMGPREFNNYFGRGVLPVGTLLFGVVSTLSRFAVNGLYHIQEKGVSILYLGFSRHCEAFLGELRDHADVRSVSLLSSLNQPLDFDRVTAIGPDKLSTIVDGNWQPIVIDPDHQPSPEEKQLLISARLSGTPVLSLSDYYELHWYMVPVDHLDDDWFLRTQGFSMIGSPLSRRLKLCLDVALSVVILILTVPLIALCAILIKSTSRGPIFFQQTRIGLHGKPFTIYKLRSMHQDAERSGPQWASANDPRVTKIGNFLRKSRLDELPQCWNVLCGDMSFIGPRPERPEFTDTLNAEIPYYSLRHIVKPGISGWAQVIFPYGASKEDAIRKLQYELYYIKHQSLLLDLNIVVRTAFTVFQRAGR
jgi:exopolysaccharide biosynthesis polyprenyl glycosylphosphotransferase